MGITSGGTTHLTPTLNVGEFGGSLTTGVGPTNTNNWGQNSSGTTTFNLMVSRDWLDLLSLGDLVRDPSNLEECGVLAQVLIDVGLLSDSEIPEDCKLELADPVVPN